MSTNNVVLLLRRHVKAVRPDAPDGLPVQSHFMADWHLDSLDLVEFAARIEQQFNIMIPDEDLPQFVSLEASEQYIRARLPS